jgi:hypothetical protein
MNLKEIYKKYPPTKYIYRGSLHYKKILHPRDYRDNQKIIFGTSSLELAISYIRKNNANISQADSNKLIYLFENIPNEFINKLSNPGYIYILDKKKFSKSKYKNLKTEYISSRIQKPIDIICIKNPLKILQQSPVVKLCYK